MRLLSAWVLYLHIYRVELNRTLFMSVLKLHFLGDAE